MEVDEIVADMIAECVEDGGSSEKREAVEDDVVVRLEKRLMEGGSGEKTVEVGEIAADLVEECVEDEGSSKKEPIEEVTVVGLEDRLMKGDCGEETLEITAGINDTDCDAPNLGCPLTTCQLAETLVNVG